MEGILVPIVLFICITSWILGPRFLKSWHELRLKEIEAGRRPAVDGGLLEARTATEERLRNLESIVCSVDFELNAKLNRLASRQLALPGPATPRSEDPSGYANTVSVAIAARLEPGQRVAERFVIEHALGEGGMGTVYLARDEKLGGPVALKLLRDMHIAQPQMLDRFRREVSAARRISHPNVVRLHDLGDWNGMMFISMEHVDGDSLRVVMSRMTKIPPDRLRPILKQICDGLEAAHAAGVVHRDLKPENVLFTSAQQVKLIDFGIAKLIDLEGMTATRMILGTPRYMAPEQIQGKPVDLRADLYSVGVVAFEALTGTPPFDGPTPIAISYGHCSGTIPSLQGLRPDLPAAWDTFVKKALAKDAADRFDSAAAMRSAVPA